MNSFTLHAVGTLCRDPEQLTRGNTAYTRICMTGNDYTGGDGDGSPREIITTLWLSAFGTLGEIIARNSRKGDQLFVQARVASRTDRRTEQTEYTFIITGLRFGAPGRAKREQEEAAETEAAIDAAAHAAQG